MDGHVTFYSATNGFTPIYDAQPPKRFVSVNAGDHALYVGGGSINLAFARAFQASGIDEGNFLDLHRHALEQAKLAPSGVLISTPAQFVPALNFCYARASPQHKQQTPHIGFSVLDLWQPTDTGPFHNANNCAMLYVVGPKGNRSDLQIFLRDVELTGENLMRCVTEANALLGDQARRETMRVCAISSGVYKHRDATKVQVAAALIRGMEKGFESSISPDVEFAYDEDAFQRAWRLRR